MNPIPDSLLKKIVVFVSDRLTVGELASKWFKDALALAKGERSASIGKWVFLRVSSCRREEARNLRRCKVTNLHDSKKGHCAGH